MIDNDIFQEQKIYYTPLQAAIRLSNLGDLEQIILGQLGSNPRPRKKQLSKWPAVYLFNERIFDAIINKELPCGKNGVTCEIQPNDPELTVRHIDLKRWISAYYPSARPRFLFNEGYQDCPQKQDAGAVTITMTLPNQVVETCPKSPKRFMRLEEVQERVGIKRSTIYRLMAKKAFPQNVQIGIRALMWDSQQIENWIAQKSKDSRVA